MKKAIVLIILLSAAFFCPGISAAEVEYDSKQEIYSEIYKISGADKIKDALPTEIAKELETIDISGADISRSMLFTPENIFSRSLSFIKSGGKRPLSAGLSVLAVLLFSAVTEGLYERNKTVGYVLSLGITVLAVLPAAATLYSCVKAISDSAVFMMSFVPIYAAVLLSHGKPSTAAGFSSVMLMASEAVTLLCSYVLTPLNGIQLALAVGGSTVSDINISSVCNTVKKVSMWTLSLATTVLLGILGIQTAVASSADSLSDKTLKFIVGSAVPVVGSTVSEALGTVRSCLKLLRNTTAAYAVAAVGLLILPTLTELLLWRISLAVSKAAAEMLGQSSAVGLLGAVDSAVAFTMGIMILIGILFIISTAMVAAV